MKQLSDLDETSGRISLNALSPAQIDKSPGMSGYSMEESKK